MACATCPPAPVTPSLPLPVPAPGNCSDGEACAEVQSSNCVVYEGEYLPTIEAEAGDSLTLILQQLDALLGKGNPASVYIESTSSIKVSGQNTPAAPLRLHAIPDRVEGNLLRSTKTGLSVVVTKPVLAGWLEQIKADPELQQLFCSICPPREVVVPSVPQACQAVDISLDGASYRMGTSALFGQAIAWTPPTVVASLTPAYQLTYQTTPTWTNTVAVRSSLGAYDFLNLPVNRIVELRLQTPCEDGTVQNSNTLQVAFITPPTLLATVTENSVTVNFTHLGADVTSYQVQLLDSSGALVAQTTLTPTSASLSYPFTGLTAGTTYQIKVVAVAHGFASEPATLTATTTAADPCPEIGTFTVTVQ